MQAFQEANEQLRFALEAALAELLTAPQQGLNIEGIQARLAVTGEDLQVWERRVISCRALLSGG